MLGGNRIERVNELVRKELSELLLRSVDFQAGTLTTITKVTCSPDLEHAKVWVSVMPIEYADTSLGLLQRATGDLQYQLVRKLKMEPVPKIRFLLDDTELRAAQIEQVIDKLQGPA